MTIKASPAGSYFCKCKHFLATITEKINEFNQGDTCWPLSRDNFIADVRYVCMYHVYMTIVQIFGLANGESGLAIGEKLNDQEPAEHLGIAANAGRPVRS